MSKIVTLPQPKATFVKNCPGMVCVYGCGWHKELVTDVGQIPLSGLVGIYSFEWTARLGMRRWLRRATGPAERGLDER